MVKLYGCVLIALALAGRASSSAISATGSSVPCSHTDTKTNTACVKAWIASESTRALRQTRTLTHGGRRNQDAGPSITEEPNEDFSLTDGGSNDDSSLSNDEPADDTTQEPTEYPPVGDELPPSDDQPFDEPPTDGEPTDEPPLYDLPTDEPLTDGEPTDEPPSDDYPTEEPLPATTAPPTTTEAPIATTAAPLATTTVPISTMISPSISTTAPPLAPMCTAKPQRGDQLAGIDIVTDVSCVKGGFGCLGTVCRFCKRWDSASSKHLTACDLILSTQTMTTTPSTTSTTPATPAPQATSQADVQCGAWLSTGDRAVGILIALDRTCVQGGVGCITGECRYCRSWETTQSRHMKNCSLLASVATPLTAIPSTPSSSGPNTEPVCDNLLSSGDRAVGILVVSDNNCAKGGLGCIGSSCRYCRVKDTPQSKHLMQCSTFPSGPTLEPTPVPVPAPTTATPATSSDCANWSTTGDRAVGIFVAIDTTCARGGVGCIRTTSCRYCRKQDTTQSHHLKECSQFSTVVDAATVVTKSFSASSESGTTSAASQVGLVSVCVVAAVAIAGFVTKRMAGRKHDVELSTPTFISHRSVSVSTL